MYSSSQPRSPAHLWQQLSLPEKPALLQHPLSLPLPGKESLLLRPIPPLRPLLTLTPLGPPSQVKLVTQPGLQGKAIGTPHP